MSQRHFNGILFRPPANTLNTCEHEYISAILAKDCLLFQFALLFHLILCVKYQNYPLSKPIILQVSG